MLVCNGYRCGALLSGPAGEGLAALRHAVANSRRAVLVSTGCLGGCAVGPVMAVSTGRLDAGRLQAVATRWLGPMQAGRTRALARWVADGGPLAASVPTELEDVELRAASPAGGHQP